MVGLDWLELDFFFHHVFEGSVPNFEFRPKMRISDHACASPTMHAHLRPRHAHLRPCMRISDPVMRISDPRHAQKCPPYAHGGPGGP